jgi:UPF0755 protein
MRTHQKTKKSKKWIVIILALLVVAAIIGLLAVNLSGDPVDESDNTKVSIVVSEGASTEVIGDSLQKEGLIKSTFMFKLKSKLAGNDGKYKPGVYSLSKSQSMEKMMNIIISGESEIARFTIPEGYTLEQTMDVIVEAGLTTKEEFLDEVKNGDFDYTFIKDLPSGDKRLEGYLYPDTYEVYKNASAHSIIDKMLARFDNLVTPEDYDKAEKMDYSMNEIVIIASLIERETRVEDERAKVASVIYNRLDDGMKLQIDAAVQYALGETKERLLYSDLEIDSPYNTYKIAGLPVGPICSPRIESIKAALNPADTDYLYYVMAPQLDGTHNFSETAAEFEKNKAAYKEAMNNK